MSGYCRYYESFASVCFLQTMMPASCIRWAKGACAKTSLKASSVYYDTRGIHVQLAASTSGQTALEITPPGAMRRRTRLPVRHHRRGTRPSLSSRHQVFIMVREEYTCYLQRIQAGKQRWRSHHRAQCGGAPGCLCGTTDAVRGQVSAQGIKCLLWYERNTRATCSEYKQANSAGDHTTGRGRTSLRAQCGGTPGCQCGTADAARGLRGGGGHSHVGGGSAISSILILGVASMFLRPVFSAAPFIDL